MKSLFKDEITLFQKYRDLLSRVKPFRNKILFILFLDICVAFISLVYPYLIKPFVDVGVIKKNLGLSITLALISGALYIISEFILILRELYAKKYQTRAAMYLSKNYINHLYGLDLAFFKSNPSMNQVTRANYYLSQLDPIIFDQIPKVIASLGKAIFILAICFMISFKISLFVFLLLPFILIHKIYFNKKDRALSNAFEKKQQDISVKLGDSFSKIQIVKYFSKEKKQIGIFLINLFEKIKIINKSRNLNLVGDFTGRILIKIATGLVFLFGLYEVQKSDITFGSLSAIMLYFQQFVVLTKDMTIQYNSLSKKLFYVSHYFEIMSKNPLIKNPEHPLRLERVKGRIEFQNVRFGYGPKNPVFDNIGFKIEGGKWVAVVGKSGIGKTTLFNLTLRLFDPEEGSITLDGHDIRKFNLSYLTKNIVIAPQEPLLFNLSIRENIIFSLDEKNEEKMTEAARLCHIDDFIMGLPEKYDTIVGEDGCNLSRGQRQRIVLARAIINNPPVLILDEATSSLDSETEKNIYENIKKTRAGLTTIVTSHRFSTAELSDYVIFIKDPKTILAGNYEGLLKEGI